jgi:hypothetical protein
MRKPSGSCASLMGSRLFVHTVCGAAKAAASPSGSKQEGENSHFQGNLEAQKVTPPRREDKTPNLPVHDARRPLQQEDVYCTRTWMAALDLQRASGLPATRGPQPGRDGSQPRALVPLQRRHGRDSDRSSRQEP